MERKETNPFNQVILGLAVCIVSTILGLVLGSLKTNSAKAYQPLPLPQTDEKVIRIDRFAEELLNFRDFSVRNVKIAPGQTFSANSIAERSGGQTGEWLENLQFSFQNKSNKQITYITFGLQFLDTLATGPLMHYSGIGMGVKPNAPQGVATSEPLALNPGESVVFTLPAKELKGIKEFLGHRNFKIADLNKVVITVGYIIFDDGIKWSGGHHFKPNPNARGGYEQINQ